MSVETELRAALVAWPALSALVGSSVTQNAMDPGKPVPYVVFTCTHAPEMGVDGATLLGDVVTIELQCWAATAAAAASVAAAVAGCLASLAVPITGRATGYDAETNLDAEIITATWVTG